MKDRELLGFMADSSFFRNASGGRKYHLQGEDASLCGRVPLLVTESGRPWLGLPEILKCKRCLKALAGRNRS